ncbi:MAG: hypothetical protein IPK16_24830 [Anaerolineales bacterium]|nr:hypothetical protein [Anaerolineales bacterium]
MHLNEGYAYQNRLRRLHPGYKLALALTTIIGCLLLSDPFVSLVAIVWMAVSSMCCAGCTCPNF